MVKIATYIFLLFFLCNSYSNVQAQKILLQVNCIDNAKENATTLKLKTEFSTVALCFNYLLQMPSQLQSQGYLAVSIDSVTQTSNAVTVQLFLGEKYTWQALYIQPSDVLLIQQLGFTNAQFTQKPFNSKVVLQLQEKLLQYFENNGYPFAAIKFDSIVINQSNITAKLKIDKGIVYKMDSIRVFGNAKISKTFLYKYLGIPQHTLYNVQALQGINAKLLQLPYLQQLQPWRLSMLGNSYLVDFFLDNKPSNQVDALVGFLPANAQLGGKLLFTVDAKLKLQNAFAGAETIALNWQQIQPQSPRLNFQFQKPYVFKTNFGLDAAFDLFKKDSSFLNLNSSIGLQYLLSQKQTIKILLQSFKTNLLDVDTLSIKLSKQLPDIIDASTNSLAIDYAFNNTNYKQNPSNGIDANIFLSTGLKKIRQNNAITQIHDPNFNYTTLYNAINTNTYAIRLRVNAAKYFKASKFSVVKTSTAIGLVQSPQIFRNEMFQIGGYKLLRGFDEESIFTNKFLVATMEYRYLASQNGYFSAFSDIGFTSNSLTNKNYSYISFGAGMALQSKQGIINLMVASGKRNDLPVNLKQLKIHLGFVSLF